MFTKNPQPGEARRWLRQAEADLVAASNDLSSGNPSYEWACFKCHQVKKIYFIHLLLIVLKIKVNNDEVRR